MSSTSARAQRASAAPARRSRALVRPPERLEYSRISPRRDTSSSNNKKIRGDRAWKRFSGSAAHISVVLRRVPASSRSRSAISVSPAGCWSRQQTRRRPIQDSAARRRREVRMRRPTRARALRRCPQDEKNPRANNKLDGSPRAPVARLTRRSNFPERACTCSLPACCVSFDDEVTPSDTGGRSF